MVTLEQVKLLESKVVKAIGYVEKVSTENTLLRDKLDANQKRIDELEILVQRFKEDQGRIEDGILSALDRLNQFEDAIERSISGEPRPAEAPARDSAKAARDKPAKKPAEKPEPPVRAETPAAEAEAPAAGADNTDTEISPELPDPDIPEPVNSELDLF
jgi:TolA-binding protein